MATLRYYRMVRVGRDLKYHLVPTASTFCPHLFQRLDKQWHSIPKGKLIFLIILQRADVKYHHKLQM